MPAFAGMTSEFLIASLIFWIMNMIPEFGHYALILALAIAVIQATLPLAGVTFRNLPWMYLAKYTTIAQWIFISIAFFTLVYSFIINDFSVAYVAQNSNSHLPLIYRICAVWGAHEGSLLLWVFILSSWTLAVSIFSRTLPLEMLARILSVLAMISTGFLLFLLLTSNPFVRLLSHIPQDGQDLNPLLQDPGLAIHPPILYMGYVGFAVPFAFAIAALMSGKLDAAWARWSRPWTLVAWSFLTLGITLGSWWAYRELGWGGFWFWDPVENASFLPWLAGIALIHSLIATENRYAFKAWTVLLAICAFSLSLLGTFLVRSGVLVSVHAFAQDPARGDFMLLFLGIVIGGSLLLYAFRAHTVHRFRYFSFFSRETLLLANNVFFTVATATVLLGTLYPLVIQALALGKISVGPPYFNTVFFPLMIPALFLMGTAPVMLWRETSPLSLIKQLRYAFFVSVTLAVVLLVIFTHSLKISTLTILILAFWIITTTLQSLFTLENKKLRFKKTSRKKYGMVIAHIGVAISLIGIILTSNYSVEKNVRVEKGDIVTVGAYQFQFLGAREIAGSNYTGIEAGVLVSKDGKEITLLKPQQRLFNVQQMGIAKTAIDVGLFRDLYVALGEPIDNSWTLRIYDKPFVRWIWLGGVLVMIGGLLASIPRHPAGLTAGSR